MDYDEAATYWIQKDRDSIRMDEELLKNRIEQFITAHNTCALATACDGFVRCTPIEYTYMNGEFWFVSEGGNKFIGLEKNKNVSLAIFEYYGDVKDSHGLQVMGTAVLYNCYSDEFKKLLAFKGIPYDALKAAKVEVAAVRVIPNTFEMYDTDFVKAGYDVRQTVKK